METKHGYDLSHWNSDEQYNECRKDTQFIILKATDGGSFIDKTFHKRAKELIHYGYNTGFYHFWRDAIDPVVQAKHFCDTIAEHWWVVRDWWCNGIGYTVLPILLVLDVENCVVRKKDIDKFLDYVKEYTGQKPTLYTSLDNYKKLGHNGYTYWIPAWSRSSESILKLPNVIMHQKKSHIAGREIDIDYVDKNLEWFFPTK